MHICMIHLQKYVKPCGSFFKKPTAKETAPPLSISVIFPSDDVLSLHFTAQNFQSILLSLFISFKTATNNTITVHSYDQKF